MTVGEIAKALSLNVLAGREALAAEVEGGYVSDLLSNVMGRAAAGDIWVTMQGHPNIVAVASLAGLAAVVVAGGATPEEETVAKAEAESVALLTSGLAGFELVGQLYRLGVRGR